jgi:hypothetical protein
MTRSLRRFLPDAVIWVLCLDDAAESILIRKQEPGIRIISNRAFEASDPELVAAKRDGRSLIEYYFSTKPSLVAYVFNHAPEVDFVSYVDADIWFFGDPTPFFEEAGDAPVLLTPHRFSSRIAHMVSWGFFNAGWLSFRRSQDGMACLEWWRQRCIEWCRDWIDEANDRNGDQRYLNQFPRLFPQTHASSHKGANLAPWNIGDVNLTLQNGEISVDGRPLVFFHFHGIKLLAFNVYRTAHDAYCAPLNRMMCEVLYRPYIGELRRIDRELAPLMPPKTKSPLRRGAPEGFRLRAEARHLFRLARAWWRGTLIRVPG